MNNICATFIFVTLSIFIEHFSREIMKNYNEIWMLWKYQYNIFYLSFRLCEL